MTQYIDIHVLQSLPAANVNRGEDGLPKSVIYGGINRARVSSQSWKRAMRLDFEKETTGSDWLKDTRTKMLPQILIDKLVADGMDEETAKFNVKGTIESCLGKTEEGKDGSLRTKALTMLSKAQIDKLAVFCKTVKLEKDSKDNWAVRDKNEKKALHDLLKEKNSLALAVFGRMVASDASLNVEAASQVAHAFSINALVPEFDYFTAVDDDDRFDGAAMIDDAGFNASVLYRYANLNVDELKKNLDNDELVNKGVEHFIRSFVLSMPTGKQNTFANRTLPSYVMITLRSDTPVSLASAFEKPVKPDYIENGIVKLEEELNKSELFVEKPEFIESLTAENSNLPKADNLNGLINDVISKLN